MFAQIIRKRRKQHTRLRLSFRGSRTVEALSGGAASHDQQQ